MLSLYDESGEEEIFEFEVLLKSLAGSAMEA